MSYHQNWDGHIHNNVFFSPSSPVILAGPCLFESWELGFLVATFLKKICTDLNLSYVFKSSYDKANRTSKSSVRGPGIEKGLSWMKELRSQLEIPILTDVHSVEEVKQAADVADMLQIPAFLFQNKQILATAAETGKVILVKKGQWATAQDMLKVAEFISACGNPKVALVERGTLFGYNNLVVDFRNLVDMGRQKNPVVFDATHSVQLPSAGNGVSGGLRQMVAPLVRAALGVGVDALFMEVHCDPQRALSDAETQLSFDMAEAILKDLSLLRKGSSF